MALIYGPGVPLERDKTCDLVDARIIIVVNRQKGKSQKGKSQNSSLVHNAI